MSTFLPGLTILRDGCLCMLVRIYGYAADASPHGLGATPVTG